jgi:hypothetical protein
MSDDLKQRRQYDQAQRWNASEGRLRIARRFNAGVKWRIPKRMPSGLP